MQRLTEIEKSKPLFSAILMLLVLMGCAKEPLWLYLYRENAFLSTEQMLAQVNERYPNAHLLELKLKQGKGSAYEWNYYYEIKLNSKKGGDSYRALKVNAHDGSILSDESFLCSLLNLCPWRAR